jgi:hypothetical protein
VFGVGDGESSPASVSQALVMLDRALDYLNATDAASLPAGVQARALRALGRVEAKHTAARARVLAGFTAQDGFEDDGHGTARAWLKWQTQVTAGAAGPAARPAMPAARAGRPAAGSAAGGDPAHAGSTCPGGEPGILRREPLRAEPEPLGPELEPLSPGTRDRLRRALLGLAADALSGPDGLAARLRAALDGTPLTTVSLPLDIGAATETIPAHLRRAVTTRHPHCAFPGCDQPASVCDIHHLIPRARGGPTTLPNLAPLCGFHHQIAVHRWGWALQLNPDGTTTATSPDRTRVLHSHSPPSQAA